MGVIHKLRDDVITFILSAKKDNPSIGVRRLAALTSEQFRIQISKSSVNSLLKRSGMSSSIGRRPGQRGRADKFFIPEEKKNQILKSMEKAGFSKQETPAEAKKEASPAQTAEPLQEKEPVAPELPPKEEVAPREKRAREPLVQQPRPQKKGQEVPLSGGSGFIFLKAAEWDIGRQSLVAEVFKKHIQGPVSQRFDSISDMFLFFKFLGVESMDHIEAYRRHGLWVFNHFCGTPAHEEKDLAELQGLFEWVKKMEGSPSMESFSEDLRKAKEQAFFEVKGFKLLLEDRSEISMDASMGSFAGGGTVPLLPCRSFPVQKAMERLSNCLISNVCSAVFQKAPGDTAFDRAFYDMAAVFENIPGKRILRASVVDEQNEEIAGFSTVPFQKRTFLMGIGPDQKEFENLTRGRHKISEKRPFYHEETEKILYYGESQTDFLSSFIHESATRARVITLWEEGKNAPFWAILTNDTGKNSKHILTEYINQWPYFGETLEKDSILTLKASGGQELGEAYRPQGESHIFSDFVMDLHRYCQKHFFPRALSKIDLTYLFTNVYSSTGGSLESESGLTVTLDVPERAIDRKDLAYAVQRVNERHILDYSGRRLWVRV